MTYEVEVDGWRLGLIAGSWLYPDGDGYEVDEAGDVWVAAPDGRTATIAWSIADDPSFARILNGPAPNDLGAFEARTTERGPVTRVESEAFLRRVLTDLLEASRDIGQR